MKKYGRNILLLMAVALTSVTSCVNDGLTEGPAAGAGKIASLNEQAASMEATVGELNALQAVAEGHETSLDAAVEALEAHIADLKDGAALMDGTMATFACQKKLAEVMGIIEAADSEGALKKQLATLEKGIAAWVGKNFDAYYPVVKAEALAAAKLAGLELGTQKIHVEAILSDVEAGLRKGADKEELTALAAAVNGNVESAEELAAGLAAAVAEVHAEYARAVETVFTDPENFDLPALKSFNSAVASTLSAADNTLAGLIARVEACETQLDEIKSRLEELEAGFADLEKLLGMIQSVTFMSDYSANTAVAYYNLATTKNSEGLLERTPEETLTLKYIVRPAASASALADKTLWNNSVKVIGYYAGRIGQSSVTMQDFTVNSIEADATSGIVTVKVANNLSTDFYFKKTGAKMALSVATGKTDLTTTFVEVVPKDASSTVYVENLSISTDYVEVDDGLTTQLRATITPDDATDSGLTWTTSNADVAEVSAEGVVTAKSVGEAVITVTARGIDEWGQTLSKTCTVKVLPNIKIVGSTSVERGGSIELRVESPDYIAPESVMWAIPNEDDKSFATLTASGTTVTVNAVSAYYDFDNKHYLPIYIDCSVNGTTLTHELYVIEVQPKSLTFNSLDDIGSMSLKIGTESSMAATINPSGVDLTKFKVNYTTHGGTDDSIAKLGFSDGKIEAKGVGSQTFMAQVAPVDLNYYYPSGSSYLTRYLTVYVEPYWVTDLELSAPDALNVDSEATITTTFTSDVPGKAPTNTTLSWKSSDESVATVDQNGKVKGISTGTAYITATTAADATKDNVAIERTCTLTVKNPATAVTVGGYYYSDGTWGTDANPSGKSVIGVIFANANAYSSDPHLQADGKTECINGLAVSLVEGSDAAISSDYSRISVTSWLTTNGYNSLTTTDSYVGYSITKGWLAINAANYISYQNYVFCTEICDSDSDYMTLVKTVSAPTNSSGWYVASYAEMKTLFNEKSTINDSLGKVNGTSISDTDYWTSNLGSNFPNGAFHTFTMSTGNWSSSVKTISNEYKLRYVIAF